MYIGALGVAAGVAAPSSPQPVSAPALPYASAAINIGVAHRTCMRFMAALLSFKPL
jgi:hypothetical protein